jgi:hypothetical protein
MSPHAAVVGRANRLPARSPDQPDAASVCRTPPHVFARMTLDPVGLIEAICRQVRNVGTRRGS